MMDSEEELLRIAERLDAVAPAEKSPEFSQPLADLEAAAKGVGEAWSGSWLGYQANVYYAGLKSPPPGANFSIEWGFKELHSIRGTEGDWKEFRREDVEGEIYARAKKPDFTPAREASARAAETFEREKSDALSMLSDEAQLASDTYLASLKERIESTDIYTRSDQIEHMRPKAQLITRDTLALGQGLRVPAHLSILADVYAIRSPFQACARLAQLARQAGSHLKRKKGRRRRVELVGTNVFICHGRSLLWRELKDFVSDRLHLPWDEFNRVPVAGVTNVARLSEMLESAAIAFLVLTAEDELADGTAQARLNVVHEAGLFQGRLGFGRAIVLLEDGCAEFSNIAGLGQIRFPKGKIAAAFEEVRRVLEREGILIGD